MDFLPSPNRGSRQGEQVLGIIAHFTAAGSMNSTVRYMRNLIKAPDDLKRGIVIRDGIKYYDAEASAHYVTGRAGKTVRMVAENEAAWHAGSRKTRPQLNGKRYVNRWSIGHEICNWGGLLKKDGRFYCWPGNFTKPYEGPTPVHSPKQYSVVKTEASYRNTGGELLFPEGVIEYWEPYPEAQIDAVIKLWCEIVDRYDIKREWIAGHEDVDPTRKIDPGPAFPWERIMDKVYPKLMPIENELEVALVEEDDLEQEMAQRQLGDNRGKQLNVCTSLLSRFWN